MALTLGRVFTSQHESAHIRNDQCIYTGILQLLQIGGKLHDFLVAGHGVDGYMNLNTVAVGKRHSLRHLLRGKVTGEGAHTKVGTCQIDRIGAVKHRHFKPLHISGRTQ